MGKFTSVFGLWIMICAFLLMYQLSVQSLDPGATLGGVIFTGGNLLTPYLNNGSGGDLTFNNTLGGQLPTQSITGTSASSTQYPDWTQSVYNFVTGLLNVVVNFVGTPYYLFIWMGLGSSGAILGVVFSIINLILLVGWFTGRID